MGYFYSLGVNFDDLETLDSFKKEIEKSYILLSNSLKVSLTFQTAENKIPNNSNSFQLIIFPEGLQYMCGDKNFAGRPYFYEIRSKLYEFLINYEHTFNHAFFEFEGADFLIDNNIGNYINTYGIGDIQSGDKNAASLCDFEALYYDSKRFLDGLIISESIFSSLTTDKSYFEKFKKGYYWLPVKLY